MWHGYSDAQGAQRLCPAGDIFYDENFQPQDYAGSWARNVDSEVKHDLFFLATFMFRLMTGAFSGEPEGVEPYLEEAGEGTGNGNGSGASSGAPSAATQHSERLREIIARNNAMKEESEWMFRLGILDRSGWGGSWSRLGRGSVRVQRSSWWMFGT